MLIQTISQRVDSPPVANLPVSLQRIQLQRNVSKVAGVAHDCYLNRRNCWSG